MSAAAGISDSRYRHVVFTTAPPRPLNLGLASKLCLHTAADRVAEEETFLGWMFREAGLRATDYRAPGLRRRLPACLRALHVDSLAEARRVLRRHPQLLPTAVDAVLLGVTEFFRDPATFDGIARELASTDPSRPLRIWSAGCSDGAELYSLAMLLAELNRLDDAELLGTDCRAEAVAKAVAGVFAPVAQRGLSDERLRRFFEPLIDEGRARRASRALRARTEWRQANVLAGAEPGPWDLIACRNMAMYLRPDVAQRLFADLASALRPGGLLVLGKAERPDARMTAAAGARLVHLGPCVYRRDGEP